jgi:hypothetical protein
MDTHDTSSNGENMHEKETTQKWASSMQSEGYLSVALIWQESAITSLISKTDNSKGNHT